jgi:hypothetical protein
MYGQLNRQKTQKDTVHPNPADVSLPLHDRNKPVGISGLWLFV